MAFDSAADLLFNIGANSDDAEANVARFRQLLSTDLEGLAAQFSDWSSGVFGSLDTVKGGLIGITAAAAAVGVAAAAFAIDAGKKFADLAIEVDNASKKTGIAVGQMSALKFSADELGIPFERLVAGITKFESSIYKANDAGEAQAKVFARLGISQKDLAAGEHDVIPLLEKVADRFHAMKDGTEKAAVSRELFSRGGAELIRFLNLGSAGMKSMAEEAEKLGLVLQDKDVVAARDYEAELKRMHAEMEAIDKEVGEKSIPYLEKWGALKAAVIESVTGTGIKTGWGFFADIEMNYKKMLANIDKAVAERSKAADKGDPLANLLPPPAKVKEAAQDFHTLTTELDGMREKLAAMDGPEAKLVAELEVMRNRAQNAAAELIKLHDQGKLAPGVWEREAQSLVALRAAIGQYGEAAAKVLGDKDLEELQKYIDGLDAAKAAIDAKIVTAGRELQEKIDAQTTHTFERQVALWQAEMEKLREKLAAEGALTAANKQLLESLETAGLDKIYAEREAAYQRELVAAQDHARKMLEADMTAEQKLGAQYQTDLSKFSDVQAKKLALTAATAAEGAQIEKQYAAIRIALANEYKNKLQELTNSQGFQSMFGDKFGALIKNNEELSKQWSQSVDQSTMLVQVAVESMGEQAKEAFDKMSEGMGGAIAHALVYGGSIGKAMRQAAAATLESMAEQDIVMAIQSMAWGFYDLAVGNYEGAASAFEAAALFGSVGVGEAMLGRVAAGRQSSGAGGGGGYSNAGGGGGMGGPGNSSGGGGGGMGGAGGSGAVQVNVYGHVVGASGIEELAGMLNDAVQNRDVRLVASQTRQGPLATH